MTTAFIPGSDLLARAAPAWVPERSVFHHAIGLGNLIHNPRVASGDCQSADRGRFVKRRTALSSGAMKRGLREGAVRPPGARSATSVSVDRLGTLQNVLAVLDQEEPHAAVDAHVVGGGVVVHA